MAVVPPTDREAAPSEDSHTGLRRRSLGVRLAWATMAFCGIFIVLSVAVFTALAWTEGRERMQAELVQIEQASAATLSKAIWELDRDALQAHVHSAIRVPSVGRVAVKVALANQAPEVIEQVRAGWSAPGWAPARTLELAYEPFPGGRQVVGELQLAGDESVLWQRLRAALSSIVLVQLLQSVLLAALIMGVFNRMVTAHVQRVALHLARVRPGNLHGLLRLQRVEHAQDELSDLVEGVNQLQHSLSAYLEQQQRYEQELASHRDHLAMLVQERTAELETANQRLQNLARTDALTGLPNRRHFDELQTFEMRRTRREKMPLALLICDVDFFKAYNDRLGHVAGDECLQTVAHALQAGLIRAVDMVARIGGEEFAVLLPGADLEGATRVAERLRAKVQDCAIAHPQSAAASVVTVSIGLAVSRPDAPVEFDALYHLADEALYRAKGAGRNRVAGPIVPSVDSAGATP